MHLDLDEALRALVYRDRDAGRAAPTVPVPRHRAGSVVQALLLVERQQGPAQLGGYLAELVLRALTPGDADASWWAAHLVEEALLRVPDATPYLGVLEPLADRGRLDPSFWRRIPVTDADRLGLLRRLVVHDPPPGSHARHLDTVADLLAADPAGVQVHLTRWFDDARPLPALPDATVATAAQALLHTHRHRAVDDLTEALADCAHPHGDELLAVLAHEEPSALCRAVDRWAHDERPARHASAVAHALRVAPHVATDADRSLLRYAALALLARTADGAPHGTALALLVRDPQTRGTYLARALERFADGEPQLPVSALAAALATHPEPVLRAFRDRAREPGGAADVLETLAAVTAPALARRAAALVEDLSADRPDAAADIAAYVDRCLEHGPAGRAVLFPSSRGCSAPVRAPGGPRSRPSSPHPAPAPHAPCAASSSTYCSPTRTTRTCSTPSCGPPSAAPGERGRPAPATWCGAPDSGSSAPRREPHASTAGSSRPPTRCLGSPPFSSGGWRGRRASGPPSSGRAPAA